MPSAKSIDILIRTSYRGSLPERIERAEMAVKLADRLGDIGRAWDARMALMEAATFGGAPDKSLIAFAWLESRCELEPERFPLHDILWAYKWICAEIIEFPEISRDQIEKTVERMRVAYESYGASLRPYYAAQARIARMLDGDRDLIRKHMEKYALAARDRFADCRACETNFAAKIAVFVGDYERAHRLAEPILSGRESCAEIPHLTYGLLAVPSWEMGFADRARLYHQRGYELVRTNVDFLEGVSLHLHFALISDDEDQAVAIFKRHLSWAVDTRSAWRKLRFMGFSAALLARLQARKSRHRFHLPNAWKTDSDSAVDVTHMKKVVDAEIERLTRAMDDRNQNSWVSQSIATHLEALAR